jgi:phosphate transport system substrate-binding protein
MKRSWIVLTVLLTTALVLTGCPAKDTEGEPGKPAGEKAAIIAIDGSSTVFPIAEAVAEEFGKKTKVRVTIGVSGSGGGFKKFCKKETAISNASRPIKPSEVKLCADNGVEYVELPVAYDGIAVVVHKEADWVDHMTVEELHKLWAPEAQEKITKWNQIRTAWPDKEIHLFGPGVDSGTYDYFTEAIVKKEHSSRGDFTSSEDDNVLVQGIATDKGALGFFGLAYYVENKDKLKIVPIEDGKADNGDGPIIPSLETVGNGTYQPLSRPLFMYINKKHADRREVQDYVAFFLSEGRPLVQEVGYIPLPDKAYQLVQERFNKRITGSVFGGKGAQVGVTVEELLSKQK